MSENQSFKIDPRSLEFKDRSLDDLVRLRAQRLKTVKETKVKTKRTKRKKKSILDELTPEQLRLFLSSKPKK